MAFFADKVARRVADLIRNDPDGWVVGRFAMHHRRTGVVVWVANKAYGLHVDTGAGMLYEVTVWCLVGGSPSQKHIWRAAKSLIRAKQLASLSNQEAVGAGS